MEKQFVVNTIKAKKSIGGRAHFLLHCEMIIQGHFLHPCHQAFISIHCNHYTPQKIVKDTTFESNLISKANSKKLNCPSQIKQITSSFFNQCDLTTNVTLLK